LIRYTPESHPDFIPLQEALYSIEVVVQAINEGQRFFLGMQRVIDIQGSVENLPVCINHAIKQSNKPQRHTETNLYSATWYLLVEF
jgi:hypothetical protein